MKIICNSLYINMKNFILKIAGFIFIFSILIWFLQSFSMSFNYIDNNNEKSILQTFCEFIAPIFAPLGFGDWGAVSALFAGLIAKELIISSIGITNNVGANDLDELVGASILDSQAVVHFSSMSIVSFLVFCLLYTPCIATIGSMRSLIGSKWTAFSVFVQFAIAYSVSFFVYRLIKLFSMYGFIHSLFVICVISLISFAFFWIFVKILARTHCKT